MGLSQPNLLSFTKYGPIRVRFKFPKVSYNLSIFDKEGMSLLVRNDPDAAIP